MSCFGWNFQLDLPSLKVDEILEKLWELDKSWRNNLVFYGLRGEDRNEEDQRLTEQKIR